MKNNTTKKIALFMILIVFTMPFSVSGQVISSDSENQGNSVSDETNRRLSEPPNFDDIVGEDIIINVEKYEPDVLRSGLIEDQNVNIFALLSGTQSNPTIKVPRINKISIYHVNVTTEPEGKPVSVGKITTHFPSSRKLSLSNLGYLQIPLVRIPKEEDVPDEIMIGVKAKVFFSVSSGLGSAPVKMVLREEGEMLRNIQDSRFDDVYIEASEITSDSVKINIYDENFNLLHEGINIKEGKSSKSLKKDSGFFPGQLFDRLEIEVKDIRDAGKTLKIKVKRGGEFETHKISEGETIYPGSSIKLTKIEKRGDKAVAEFRSNTEKKIIEFVTSLSDSTTPKTNQDNPKSTSNSQLSSLVIDQFNLAIGEYGILASEYDGTTFKFGVSSQLTSIGDFKAIIAKALLFRDKVKDYPNAIKEFEKLLNIYDSYDATRQNEASGVFPRQDIEKAIQELKEKIKNPNSKTMIGEILMKESSGELVSIMVNSINAIESIQKEKSSMAHISVDGNSREIYVGEVIEQDSEGYSWAINKIQEDSIIVTGGLKNQRKESKTIKKGEKASVELPIGNQDSGEKIKITLDSTILNKEAHIIVRPNTENAFSNANFNIHIPIEKRALDLPLFSESIEEEINKTEKLIEKLDKLLVKVEKVHNTWKKVCFATYAFIAVKNFVYSIFGSGDGRAKSKAIELFKEDDVYKKNCVQQALTLDECILQNEGVYNDILSNVKSSYDYSDGEAFTGELGSFDADEKNSAQLKNLAFLQKMANQTNDTNIQEEYWTEYFNYIKQDQNKKVMEGLKKEDMEDMANPKIQSEIRRKIDEGIRKKYNETINNPSLGERDKELLKELMFGQIVGGTTKGNFVPTRGLESVSDIAKENTNYLNNIKSRFSEIDANQYKIDKIDDSTRVHYRDDGTIVLFNTSSQTSLLSTDGKTYSLTDKPIEIDVPHKPIVTFIESGTNEGKVHRMSIDAYRYAEFEYDSAGRSTVFVYKRQTPNAPIKNDNTERGVSSLENLLSSAKKNKDSKLENSLRNLQSCSSSLNKAKTFGKDFVACGGINYAINSDPAVTGVSCIEFYSPDECKLLFNACDPVLCPASRCNFGGKHQVSNVVETGIVGSTLLCLPNFGNPDTGGVIMPICITGVLAGLRNIQTILEEYSGCLKVSLNEGESVGMCDLIRSFYICDTLWKEAIQIFNLKHGLLRKIIDVFSKDDPGGGEYADFNSNIDRSINGLNYFTQQYAKDTFAQFSGGSLPEIGGEICKQAIFGKVPGLGSFMDQAMRPESPPQFTAILDKVPYTSVTPKPVAEYQVYYRIYAGANEPLTYSVYLKYEGMQGEKILPMYILVNNKRLAADQFDAENRNFQAIDGYNQVCVRYMSKTYGEKEECGFGKTTSSAAIDYLSKAYAKNEAGKGINSAQDCVPSGSSYSSPSANYLNNAGKIIAGGFSSGVMETGVVRICSGVPPGKESEWAIVGECWEGKPDEGRSKGYCWLYTPSADRIIKEHSANLGRDMEEFYSGLGKTTQQAVDSVSEYVDEMGMNIGYETSEEAESALSEARSQIEIIKRKDKGEVQQNYIKAIELLQKVLRGSLSDKSKVFEARSILAELYELWGTKNL